MEILFPENLRCISCSDHISVNNPYSLCKTCYKDLNKDIIVCKKCGRILGETGICFECERETYYFDEVYSLLRYNDTLHHIIYEFKYGQGTYLAKPLAQFMSDYLRKKELVFDFILFVPIGKARYRQRGFNQAQLLAEEISKNMKLPILDCFKRTRNTKFLAKLTGVQRKKEIEGAFEVNKSEAVLLKDAKILIIDDIFTTGFTLNELSKILRGYVDVRTISVYTLGNAKSKK